VYVAVIKPVAWRRTKVKRPLTNRVRTKHLTDITFASRTPELASFHDVDGRRSRAWLIAIERPRSKLKASLPLWPRQHSRPKGLGNSREYVYWARWQICMASSVPPAVVRDYRDAVLRFRPSLLDSSLPMSAFMAALGAGRAAAKPTVEL